MAFSLDREAASEAFLAARKNKVNISYSLMNSLTQCGYRTFLDNISPRDSSPQNHRNFIAGTALHKMFEDWANVHKYARGWMENPENAQLYFEEACRAAPLLIWQKELSDKIRTAWNVQTDEQYQLAKVVRGAKAFPAIAMSLRFQEHNVRLERWMTVPFAGETQFQLKGAADIWDPVTKSLYDTKVTENTQYGSPLQLMTYATMVLALDGRLPNYVAFIYPIVPKNHVRGGFKPANTQVHGLLTTVAGHIDTIKKGAFLPEPISPNECFNCPFKRACPRFGAPYWRPKDAI